MTRRDLLFLLAPLALLAIVAACGGDDEETSKATATATLAGQTAAPTAVPTAIPNSNCPAPSGDAPEPNMKTYAAAPPMTIDASKTYIATVKTVRGDFKIKLRPDLAPQHVNSFVFLANEHYFDGVTFHRVLSGFMAQAGDPTGTGSGGPGYTIPAEFSTSEHYVRGTVGMARLGGDVNSAGSQWFVTFGQQPSLDGGYTIFGEVTEGMDVVDCITLRDPSKAPNAAPGDAIISITIEEQ